MRNNSNSSIGHRRFRPKSRQRIRVANETKALAKKTKREEKQTISLKTNYFHGSTVDANQSFTQRMKAIVNKRGPRKNELGQSKALIRRLKQEWANISSQLNRLEKDDIRRQRTASQFPIQILNQLGLSLGREGRSLNQDVRPLVNSLTKASLEFLSTLPVNHLAKIPLSLATLNVRDTQILDKIEKLIWNSDLELDGRHLWSIAEGFGELGYASTPLLENLLIRAEDSQNWGEHGTKYRIKFLKAFAIAAGPKLFDRAWKWFINSFENSTDVKSMVSLSQIIAARNYERKVPLRLSVMMSKARQTYEASRKPNKPNDLEQSVNEHLQDLGFEPSMGFYIDCFEVDHGILLNGDLVLIQANGDEFHYIDADVNNGLLGHDLLMTQVLERKGKVVHLPRSHWWQEDDKSNYFLSLAAAS